MTDVKKRCVLVTGGAQRLGAHICREFAHAGWEVWCHYNQAQEAALKLCQELSTVGATAKPIHADLGDATQRKALMYTIQGNTGPLHCLVNNASSFEPDSAVALDAEAMRRQMEINLLAPMDLSGHMAQSWSTGGTAQSSSGQCSIIHVLDQKVFNLNPDYFSYTLSKLALERAVALQAQALAPRIRVCGVAPGLLFLSGPQSQENFDKASRVNLMQSPVDPDQVAATCVFLAQNPAITGVTIPVDNGQHLVPLERDVMFVADRFLKGRDV
jgi:NAD(P)-dependent dehydrogenase (short-subunit alcohol dehydrogenase family)